MNYLQKKQWIRLVCCVAILLAVSLALCGVFGGGHLLYKQQEVKETTVKGFGDGDVKITVGAGEDGTVKSLKIDASTQTEGLGAKASEEAFTSQFIGRRGPFV